MLRVIAAGIFLAASVTVFGGEPPSEFPRVHGEYQMSVDWRVTLPDEYAKRFEAGKLGTRLVLWRSGITCLTSIYNQKVGETPISTLEWRKADTPKERIQTFEFRDTKPLRYGFLLREKPEDDAERWARSATRTLRSSLLSWR